MKLILNCFGYKYRKVSPQITQIYRDYFTIEDAEDTEEDKGKLRSGQTAGSSYRSNYWIYDPLTSPILCYILQRNSEAWLNGYQISYELLIINALFTFLGLCLFIKRQDKETSYTTHTTKQEVK